jgi:hypothetical protein
MTRFAFVAAVCALGLVALPAEPQGLGKRGRPKGGGKAAAKAVQRPAGRPMTPAQARPQPRRPTGRSIIPSRGFVPNRNAGQRPRPTTRPQTPVRRPTPLTRPKAPITRPTAPNTRPGSPLTRPNIPTTRPKSPTVTRPKAPSGVTNRPGRPNRPDRPPVTVRPKTGTGGAIDRPDQTTRPGRPGIIDRPGVIDRTPGGLTRPDRDRVDRDRPDRDRPDRDRLDRDRVDRDRLDRDRIDRDRLDRDRLDRDRFDRDRRDRRPIINRRNVNRTDIDIRNRYSNRTNINIRNRWGGGYRQIGAPRSWYTQPRNWGRNWWGDRPAWYWGRPWYWHHAHWHHGYWNYWSQPPALWFGAGLLGWLLNPGDTFVYTNPYYVEAALVPTYLDYSEPLPIVSAEYDALALPPDPDDLTDPDALPPPPDDPTVAEAYRLLDEARGAFRAGEYVKAQTQVEVAIGLVPSDPALHEFRALTLFAQAKYQDAAATLYSVLTAGPGWDWETMRELYPDPDDYTTQLRALERFVLERPDAGYGHFVLAYHYLVTKNLDPAIRQLQVVVRLQPDDKLAQALLTSLTAPQSASDPPAPGR